VFLTRWKNKGPFFPFLRWGSFWEGPDFASLSCDRTATCLKYVESGYFLIYFNPSANTVKRGWRKMQLGVRSATTAERQNFVSIVISTDFHQVHRTFNATFNSTFNRHSTGSSDINIFGPVECGVESGVECLVECLLRLWNVY
jgi:hypothetical protein